MTENSCQTPNQAGTACTTYATNGPTVATAAYGPAGEMTGLTYDGFTETRTYNTLLQLTRMTATSAGQTVMDMQYTFSRSQNNGRIVQSTDGTIPGGETVVYTYDTLNRLTKAETTSAAGGEAYTYDGFGNLTAKTPTKGTAPTMTAAYDAATNHRVGQTYDANGNPGFNGTYPYDVENHLLQPLTSGTSPQWTYDPSGKRVFARTPGNGTTVATACEIYFYGITGQKLATYSCGYNDQTGGDGTFWYQLKGRNVYFGGKLMRSAGVTVVTDRLGSVRANSNGERMSYFPYGEERTSTADGREKFGTYFRDPGGVDYADQRYYASAGGQFMTPDPDGLRGANPLNSTSWNRYAYVNGDPANFTDRSGHRPDNSGGGCGTEGGPVDCMMDDGSGIAYGNCGPGWITDASLSGPCGGGGGGGAGCDDGTIVFLYSGFLPCPAPVPVPIIGDGGPDPDPKSYRTYFLVVTSDCYSVPNNGGTVTRYVSYQLDYLEEGMPAPMFTNTGTIWEHLSGDLPPAGANSPSSGPRGTYEDVLGIFFSGIAHQSLTQTFSATLDSKVSVGLAIAAFGGTVANPVVGNSIEKYPGYISINGNTGGQVQNGRLVPGTYKPCN